MSTGRASSIMVSGPFRGMQFEIPEPVISGQVGSNDSTATAGVVATKDGAPRLLYFPGEARCYP